METTQTLLLFATAGAALLLPALVPAQAPSTAPHTDATAPGLVAWHDDFDAALAAASDSGKPVLLFQLLGDLDQTFC